MKEIKLMYGGYAKVDDEDFEYLNQYRWYKIERSFYYYASARINGKSILMHKMFITKKIKTKILHINGDGLDNRKSNLKLCSYEEFNKNNPREHKYSEEERREIYKAKAQLYNKKRIASGDAALYVRNRKKVDLNYKIKCKLYLKLWMVLKTGNKKQNKIPGYEKLFGCNKEFLKQHLEAQFKEGMSWDNHSLTGWQIDHIIPASCFDLTDIEQQRKCFHYSNLQPLWVEENREKGNKII